MPATDEKDVKVEEEYSIVLVGEKRVGKTRCLGAWCHCYFETAKETKLVEDCLDLSKLDYYPKTLMYGEVKIKLKIFDAVGLGWIGEVYDHAATGWLAGADGVVLMFDVTSQKTYDQAKEVLPEICRLCRAAEGGGVDVLLVGNKTDLKEARTVNKGDAENFARTMDIQYFETSVKNEESVGAAFLALAEEIRTRKATGTRSLKAASASSTAPAACPPAPTADVPAPVPDPVPTPTATEAAPPTPLSIKATAPLRVRATTSAAQETILRDAAAAVSSVSPAKRSRRQKIKDKAPRVDTDDDIPESGPVDLAPSGGILVREDRPGIFRIPGGDIKVTRQGLALHEYLTLLGGEARLRTVIAEVENVVGLGSMSNLVTIQNVNTVGPTAWARVQTLISFRPEMSSLWASFNEACILLADIRKLPPLKKMSGSETLASEDAHGDFLADLKHVYPTRVDRAPPPSNRSLTDAADWSARKLARHARRDLRRWGKSEKRVLAGLRDELERVKSSRASTTSAIGPAMAAL